MFNLYGALRFRYVVCARTMTVLFNDAGMFANAYNVIRLNVVRIIERRVKFAFKRSGVQFQSHAFLMDVKTIVLLNVMSAAVSLRGVPSYGLLLS